MLGEAFLRKFEFDIYEVKDQEVEIALELKGIRAALKALGTYDTEIRVIISYPYKDEKLLVL